MIDHPFARLEHLEQTESTNTTLREAAAADPESWPHLSALVAAHQTAGRGRSGRSWETPPGAALTASLLLRPLVPLERSPWLTLLAGLAVVRAVRSLDPVRAAAVGLKWPNDILIDDAGPDLPDWGTARKVGGILTELLPTADGRPAAVVGVGINLTQDAGELPVPSATSLALAGLSVPPAEGLLSAVGRVLRDLLTQWESYDGDARGAGLLTAVGDACLSLGRRVRVDRPGGAPLAGVARSIDDDGRLVVVDDAGRPHAVVAGDVLHLRTPEPGPGSGH